MRNINKYMEPDGQAPSFGVFERRTEEIPSRLRILEIVRGSGTGRLERLVRVDAPGIAQETHLSPSFISAPFKRGAVLFISGAR